MKMIKFQGEEYLFTGDSLLGEGAITKQEDFEHGRASYAHLLNNGSVMRFGAAIGTREEIKEMGEPKITLASDAWGNLLTDRSWNR